MEERENQLEYLERMIRNQYLIYQEHRMYWERLERLSSMISMDPLSHLETFNHPSYLLQPEVIQPEVMEEEIMEMDKPMDKTEMEIAKVMEPMEVEVLEIVEDKIDEVDK
jgi:hypothetical protein